MNLAFFVSIPHSGEKVPDFCDWLIGLDEKVLMCDVDRYVDQLYEEKIRTLNIPLIKTEWHRYAADLNRFPADIDVGSVVNNKNSLGTFNRGFHWQITTLKYPLMSKPMTEETHQKLVKLIYEPFHQNIENQYAFFKNKGFQKVYHLDLHSMPSMGTSEHRDPGERRADIVVSDCGGKSSDPQFVDLVINSYVRSGFKVGYNWPYLGGRVSEQYGHPNKGQHAVQVELNRVLYMDEMTKKKNNDFEKTQKKLFNAIELIQKGLSKL